MQKERYKNKYIRQLLEERLKEEGFGVNIHCRKSGVYITIPPATVLDLYETQEDVAKKEDKMVDTLVSNVSVVAKTLYLETTLESVLHGDNIQIKIKVINAR